MKHGVRFISVNGNYSKHSYNDFGLLLTEQDIGVPEAKTYMVDIEGRNGSLDLSDSFGEIKYKNRILRFTFELIEKLENWRQRMNIVAGFLHGQKMKITVWSDSDYYYVGRCTVDEYNSNARLGKIVVFCDCEPYKYSQNITEVNLSDGKNTVLNGRMTVFADMYNDAEATINSKTYSKGTHLKAIKLTYGRNVFDVKGNATLSFREGEL